jgi:hypothetical protein
VPRLFLLEKENNLHDTQISAQTGGAITLAAGLLLIGASFAWRRYAIGLQLLAARITERVTGRKAETSDAHRFSRGFGFVFLGIAGLASVVFGLATLLAH